MDKPRQLDESCRMLRSAAKGISKSQTARSSLVLCNILSASNTLEAAKTLMPKLSMTLRAMLSVASSGISSKAEKTFHGDRCRLRLDAVLRVELPELIRDPGACTSKLGRPIVKQRRFWRRERNHIPAGRFRCQLASHGRSSRFHRFFT